MSGVLRHRQRRDGHEAGQRDDDGQHRREDGPVDEEIRDHGWPSRMSVVGPGLARRRRRSEESRAPTARTPSETSASLVRLRREPDVAAHERQAQHQQHRPTGPRRRSESEHPSAEEPLKDVEEHRRQEDAEERHAEHSCEDRRAQRSTHLGAGTFSDHQRQHAEDEGERRHHDRPQPQPASLDGGLATAAYPPLRAVAWQTRR